MDMDIIKTEYLREYQRQYHIEYYQNNREYISLKNYLYYKANKENILLKNYFHYQANKKEKVIKEKKIKLKKNEIMNLNLIIVEKIYNFFKISNNIF